MREQIYKLLGVRVITTFQITRTIAEYWPAEMRAQTYSNVDGSSTATLTGDRLIPGAAITATPPWFIDGSADSAQRGCGRSTTW